VRRDQELPCAGHRDSSAGSIMDTPQDTAEPIRVVGGTSVKIYLRKVKTSRREMSKEKNSKKQQREHQGQRTKGRGGGPAARTLISLQHVERTTLEQIPTLQPIENPMPEQVDIS